MLNKGYCYSFDSICYRELYETEEECKKAALQELLSLENCKEVHIYKFAPTDFKPLINLDKVLEDIMEDAHCNEGEATETYLDELYYAKKGSENYELQLELSKRLNKVLLDFLKEHDLMPDWYLVNEWKIYRFVDGELV